MIGREITTKSRHDVHVDTTIAQRVVNLTPAPLRDISTQVHSTLPTHTTITLTPL